MKLLDLLAATGRTLSSIVEVAAPGAHRPRDGADAVGAEGRGDARAGRARAERNSELVLVDGVKILHDDGWALVLPDPEEPVTHVWAEADGDHAARQLAQEYARRIRQATALETFRPSCELSLKRAAGTPRSTSGSRVDGEPCPGRDHRLRPGRPRRRRLRAAARGRRHRRAPTAPCAEVESTKSVSDIYAPGRRARSSRSTATWPTRPSGSTRTRTATGWIFVLELRDPAEVDALLDAAAYRRSSRADRLSPGIDRVEARTAGVASVDAVFCNQCGHQQRRRRQLLLVVRRAARAGRPSDDRPITVRRRRGPRASSTRSSPSSLDELARGRGHARGAAGPERRERSSLLDGDVTTAGRHPDCDIFLDDITVSRRHAEVERGGDGYRVARRRLAQRHLPEPRAHRRGAAAPTATSCRSGSSSLVFFVGRRAAA